ncbi:MAG TPA: VWA domain-containing protein [Pyrinomonadaceae bacterium]
MKKVAAVLSLLALLAVAAATLRAQTRPRRVGQSAPPAAPTASPNTSTSERQPSAPSRPPVLGGTSPNNGRTTAPQTPAAKSNDPEEVGENDVVRVNTTLVTIPVSVTDRSGRYIPNLRKENFRIYEDGVEQSVAYFASVEKPFTVVLMLDTSGSTRFKLEEIQEAAIAFVNQLRAEDRVVVVSFDDRVRVLAEATNDRYLLRNAIRQTQPGEGTRLYDAVDMVINQRLNRIQGRKAIVLFTDGVDTTSKRASYESNMRDAEELDALIYPMQFDTYQDVAGGGGYPGTSLPPIFKLPFPFPNIIIGGGGGGRRGGGGPATRGGSRADYMKADAYMRELAEKTAGRLYQADNLYNMEQSFRLIAEELRRQYSLGYYPKNAGQTGERRQVRVRVNRPELAVRARDSYIVGSQPGATTAQDTQRQSPVLRKARLASTDGNTNTRAPR